MRGNYPLTRDKTHRVLLEILAHQETTLVYKHMVKNEGRIDWDDISPPTNIVIKIDANENPLDHVSAVIHELMHIVLYPIHIGRFSDDYREIGVLAYEKDMYEHVKRSKRRLSRWVDLIAEKLKEA